MIDGGCLMAKGQTLTVVTNYIVCAAESAVNCRTAYARENPRHTSPREPRATTMLDARPLLIPSSWRVVCATNNSRTTRRRSKVLSIRLRPRLILRLRMGGLVVAFNMQT